VIHYILKAGNVTTHAYQDTKPVIPKYAYGLFLFVSSACNVFQCKFDMLRIRLKQRFCLFNFSDTDPFGNLLFAALIFEVKFNLHGDVLK